MRPPVLRWLLVTLLFQGLSALIGGLGLILDLSGESLSIPVAWLQGSMFVDYLVPGLILFIVLGLFPLMVACGLWYRRPGSWGAAFLVGVALVLWIVIEILIIGYHAWPPLQLFYGLLGVAMIVLALSPPLRRYLRECENKI